MDHQPGNVAGRPEATPELSSGRPIAGELITKTFDYDGGRLVTVYFPPAPPEALVFAADGQGIAKWGGFLEAADVPSTMIVGVHGLIDETLRLQEYSPVFDAERFAAHEKFFVEDVGQWVRSRLKVAPPIERTAVFGVSAGGELALALGLRHPDVYGAVLSCSPGAGYKPADVMPSRIPRTYLVAGTLEPFFLHNAIRWADALRAGRCGCRHERARRVARSRFMAKGVSLNGGVGVWTMSHPAVGGPGAPSTSCHLRNEVGTLLRPRQEWM